LKFLIIAALFSLLLLLLYSRVYPYLNFLRKLLGASRSMGQASAGSDARFHTAAPKPERKLVRCLSCGTWVPAERALAKGVGNAVYCSRECREKSADSNERKIAG
jgi:hypothetical protein